MCPIKFFQKGPVLFILRSACTVIHLYLILIFACGDLNKFISGCSYESDRKELQPISQIE